MATDPDGLKRISLDTFMEVWSIAGYMMAKVNGGCMLLLLGGNTEGAPATISFRIFRDHQVNMIHEAGLHRYLI